MKTVEGFRIRKLVGEWIVVPEGIGLANFNKMIVLNESAAYLWESVCEKDSFTKDELVRLLLDRYDVDEDTARKDVESIAGKWLEEGIVTE